MKPVNKKKFYEFADQVYVAVDCIIFGFIDGQLKLLLFKRKVNPFKNEWSLIGSFIGKNEHAGKAAARVLKESTGLNKVYLTELKWYSGTKRDPGGRVISLAYYALIRLNEREEQIVADFEAKWFDVQSIPPLILDHQQMIYDALEQLKIQARIQPIGFKLLPNKFTLPQLQALYEAIFQIPLDARNFRKKVLSLDLIEKLDEKDKSSSKKGAYLYRFNQHSPASDKVRSPLFEF